MNDEPVLQAVKYPSQLSFLAELQMRHERMPVLERLSAVNAIELLLILDYHYHHPKRI